MSNNNSTLLSSMYHNPPHIAKIQSGRRPPRLPPKPFQTPAASPHWDALLLLPPSGSQTPRHTDIQDGSPVPAPADASRPALWEHPENIQRPPVPAYSPSPPSDTPDYPFSYKSLSGNLHNDTPAAPHQNPLPAATPSQPCWVPGCQYSPSLRIPCTQQPDRTSFSGWNYPASPNEPVHREATVPDNVRCFLHGQSPGCQRWIHGQ